MNWTFGIITDGKNEHNILSIIDSIECQNISNYEIIIVGNSKVQAKNTTIIPFDENIKSKWITKKKNIIGELAKYDLVSIHHDYVKLDKNWYTNFVNFGENWDVCVTRVEKKDGTRFRDWMVWEDNLPHHRTGNKGKVQYLSYKVSDKTHTQYVSGSYFCVKKQYFIKNKFDENLCWGQGEDVEWSLRLRNSWNLKCNFKSKVILCKDKSSYPDTDPHSKEYYELLKD